MPCYRTDVGAMLVLLLFAVCVGCTDKIETAVPAEPTNQPPQVSDVPDQDATEGASFILDLTSAISDDNDAVGDLTFAVVSGGGSFTGALYTNVFTTTGSRAVEFMVMDTQGLSATALFNVTVVPVTNPLEITTISLPPGAVTTVYGPEQLQGANGTGTYTWSEVTDILSAYGLLLSVNGIISGTPTQTGKCMFVAQVRDDASPAQTAQKQLTIFICDQLEIATAQLPDAYEGESYVFQLQSMGGNAPLTWSLAAGSDALPGGLMLTASTGEISGMPRAGTVGVYNLIFEVTDSLSTPQSAIKALTLAVKPSLLPQADFIATPAYGSSPLIVSFLDFSSGDITSWEWDFDGNGTPDSTDPNATWTYSNPGWYTVELTVSGPGGSDTLIRDKCIQVVSSTWYIDTENGDDSNGGTSWLDAFETIQTGIDAATDLDLVLVADGTYSGASNLNLDFAGKKISLKSENGRENCIIDCEDQGMGFYFHSGETTDSVVDGFTLMRGMTIWGGAGIFCDGSSPTIINCLLSKNTAAGAGIGAAICCANGSDAAITNCVITSNYAEASGGGVFFSDSSPTITNCVVQNNFATWGGGIFGVNSSGALISGCTIDNNMATSGAGCIFGMSSPTITDCTITNNWVFNTGSGSAGGGIVLLGGDPIITDCVIANNTGSDSIGAGMFLVASYATITGCSITDNMAMSGISTGGGIHCEGAFPELTDCHIANNRANMGGGICCSNSSNATITNCVIQTNNAATGAGVFVSDSNLVVADSIIEYNAAEGGNGGGLYFTGAGSYADMSFCTVANNSASGGGGVFAENVASFSASDCIFSGNWAAFGAGMVNSDCAPTVADCIFIGNGSGTGGGMVNLNAPTAVTNCLFTENFAFSNFGGAIYNGGAASSVAVSNCTFLTNMATAAGGAIHNDNCAITVVNSILWDNAVTEIGSTSGGSADVTYSCVTGGPLPGAGNIADDPLFVPGPKGNFYLSQIAAGQGINSPCLNAGSSAALSLGLDTKTTRTDGVTDTGQVDIGYHHDP